VAKNPVFTMFPGINYWLSAMIYGNEGINGGYKKLLADWE